jgi:hypothetical protein
MTIGLIRPVFLWSLFLILVMIYGRMITGSEIPGILTALVGGLSFLSAEEDEGAGW